MSRMTMAYLLTVLVVCAGCGRGRAPQAPTPPPLDTARPNRPTPAAAKPGDPAYLATARQFLQHWQAGADGKAYALLSTRLQGLMTQRDFAAQLGEVSLKDFQVTAHAGSETVGYVVASVHLAQAPAAGPGIAGYSLLLKKTAGQWRVALFLAEEKLAGKYGDLLIIPAAKGKGYVVTYTDEKGHQVRSDLQEP